MAKISFLEAINQALEEEMERDSSVIVFGEEIGPAGGRFGATKGLFKKFGESRVLDAPINEEILVGVGLGAALGGLRPIFELMYANFLPIALDDIYRAGLWNYIHNSKINTPLVVRIPVCGYIGAGAEIASSLISLAIHIPGVKVVVPYSPYDAKGLLKSAIRDNRPVLFFEHVSLYKKKGEVPRKSYTVPFGKAILRKKGNDVTIIAVSFMVEISLQAAEILEKRGISAEVLDLRTLVPLDIEAVLESIKRTGKIVIVEEDMKRGGIGAEIAASIVERNINVKMKRVAAKNIPLPYGELERYILPSKKVIMAAVFELMAI